MSTTVGRTERARRRHDDAPDTTADFGRLAGLPAGPERETLLESVVEAWLPMAHRLARRFRNRGETLEDLEQVAAMGLLKAVGHYDPERGVPFEPYAIPTIVGEIKRHFRDHTWDIHVPRRVQELRNKVRTAIRELAVADLDRYPTIGEIAEHAQMSNEDVLTGMEAIDSFRALSLDAQLGRPGQDDDYSLADILGQSEGRYDAVIARESVKPALAGLPEREKRILHLRFFQDMTQSRIGEELGISQMHVSRLASHACKKVREQVEAEATEAADAPVPAAA
ncbi:SigB/SigF/SigG family RNA polymerase sigma factor [Streptomyces gobiensis]|uniref:SigB/SigF/SigG family RNA polymerase sigma factor n=1 Tax=Streptomyces gobiensis TaxID=2875706 RepID=UPI001E53F234|nr:SigB/SigF/SigG family RNA polymerase sigma factor [Streptomyces gobiensis]UGY93050.1 SigB/SigF/SigG family RNA polymerase sigma factor [Streptomyces gobiensis]